MYLVKRKGAYAPLKYNSAIIPTTNRLPTIHFVFVFSLSRNINPSENPISQIRKFIKITSTQTYSTQPSKTRNDIANRAYILDVHTNRSN